MARKSKIAAPGFLGHITAQAIDAVVAPWNFKLKVSLSYVCMVKGPVSTAFVTHPIWAAAGEKHYGKIGNVHEILIFFGWDVTEVLSNFSISQGLSLQAKRNNLFHSMEIASSLKLLAMTGCNSDSALPEFIEKLRF